MPDKKIRYNEIIRYCNDLKSVTKNLNNIKCHPLTKIISFNTKTRSDNIIILSVRVAQWF